MPGLVQQLNDALKGKPDASSGGNPLGYIAKNIQDKQGSDPTSKSSTPNSGAENKKSDGDGQSWEKLREGREAEMKRRGLDKDGNPIKKKKPKVTDTLYPSLRQD